MQIDVNDHSQQKYFCFRKVFKHHWTYVSHIRGLYPGEDDILLCDAV